MPVRTEAAALDLMPFDVQSIEDLVRLARSGERLILHHRDGFTDTYLVNDDVSASVTFGSSSMVEMFWDCIKWGPYPTCRV